MDVKQELAEVEKKKQALALGGGASAIDKQHQRGKLTASERMEKLFDPGTFRELSRWAKPLKTGFDIDDLPSPRAGLVIGYGEVEGRIVYAGSFDFTVHAGSQHGMQMVKLGRAMQQAREAGVPFVGMVDSGGRQIQDLFGPWGLRPPTRVMGCEEGAFDMFCPSMASGVIPQISLMLGPCYAATAYSPIIADFVFFRKETSFMSVASPQLLKSVTFADVTQEEIGGAQLHATTTGSCDLLVDTDEEALSRCRQLLGFLPSNWREKPPVVSTGDIPNRREEILLGMVPDGSSPFNVHQLLSLVVDKGEFFELAPLYARNIVIGFARIAGQAVGIVANNPAVADGSINADSSDKQARFIRTCDCFNVPVITFVDTPGFLPSVEMEQSREGLERHAAKPVFAVCEATVPRITIYLRRCHGSGRLVMGTREMGVDAAFAWPTADLRLVGAGQSPWLERPEFAEPYRSAELMAIDDVIDPRDTRPVLANTLRRLAKKQEPQLPYVRQGVIAKKHGLIPT